MGAEALMGSLAMGQTGFFAGDAGLAQETAADVLGILSVDAEAADTTDTVDEGTAAKGTTLIDDPDSPYRGLWLRTKDKAFADGPYRGLKLLMADRQFGSARVPGITFTAQEIRTIQTLLMMRSAGVFLDSTSNVAGVIGVTVSDVGQNRWAKKQLDADATLPEGKRSALVDTFQAAIPEEQTFWKALVYGGFAFGVGMKLIDVLASGVGKSAVIHAGTKMGVLVAAAESTPALVPAGMILIGVELLALGALPFLDYRLENSWRTVLNRSGRTQIVNGPPSIWQFWLPQFLR